MDITPSTMLKQYVEWIEILESTCSSPAFQSKNQETFRVLRRGAHVVIASLGFLREAAQATGEGFTAEQLRTLDNIEDRAQELVDTFAWAADAPDELAALAVEECG